VHLHPYEARRISVAEALAIQSLPKKFELPPNMTLTDKFKTIGNGVPYLLAVGVSKSLFAFLDDCYVQAHSK
jgi:DNA (cytosine-5)-methyltransferase 1